MSDPDALITRPMPPSAPAVPSDFLDRIHAYAERSAEALELFGIEGT